MSEVVSSSLVDAELKPKRHSWFETLSCMFEKMKVGGRRKRTTSPSTPRISASHSTALNTAHRKLISLRHAFQCKNKHCKKQKCPKTKLLLVHVSTCKNKDCDVPDCIISRRLLSHYRYCTNMECPLCMPIRVFLCFVSIGYCKFTAHHIFLLIVTKNPSICHTHSLTHSLTRSLTQSLTYLPL